MFDEGKYQALVLNADYLPLSTAPLSHYNWRDAIALIVRQEATALSFYDKVVRSPSTEMYLPSVIVLHHFVNLERVACLNRGNVFLAYRFRCLYCGRQFASKDLTYDHVIPRSRKGKSDWANLVPACVPCNQAKGNRTLQEIGWTLRQKPYQPTLAQLNALGREFPVQIKHESWLDFLYWSVALEP